jgi:hypothetical protein
MTHNQIVIEYPNPYPYIVALTLMAVLNIRTGGEKNINRFLQITKGVVFIGLIFLFDIKHQ